MWLGVIAEFCRRNDRRSIYAGASDRDFVPGAGGQIKLARDRWIYRRGLASVDAIVAQNEEQLRTCRTHLGREAVLIPSCYEMPAATKPRQQPDRILWVGRIHPSKRPHMLLELAARLPARRFVMVGGTAQGPGMQAFFDGVREQAARLPNVELTGFLTLDQVEPWFDRARVFVNTSLYEGMPNTFLQAWARDVPTVGTVDVGAPVHQVAMDLDSLAQHTERLFAEAPGGRRYRDYFEHNHSCDEAMRRYGGLFDQLRDRRAA
jgi:glycosyltransferase involved in cell wall biosynthesis